MSLEDDIHDIVTSYLDGQTSTEIAKVYSVTPSSILRVLREAGVQIRGRHVAIDDDALHDHYDRFRASGGRTCAEYVAWHESPEGAGSPCLATLRNRRIWNGPGRKNPDPVADIIPPPPPMVRFAERRSIFEWLYLNGLTMPEIADAAGVDTPTVSRALADTPKRPYARRTGADLKVESSDNGSTLAVRIRRGATVKTVSTTPEFAAILVEEFGRMLAERGE